MSSGINYITLIIGFTIGQFRAGIIVQHCVIAISASDVIVRNYVANRSRISFVISGIAPHKVSYLVADVQN